MAIEGQGDAESNVGDVNASLRALEGISGMSEETKAGLTEMQTNREEGVAMPGSEGAQAPVVETPPVVEEEGAAPAVETPAEEGKTLDEEFVIDSPLYGGEKNIGKPNEAAGSEEQNFENLDSLNTYLKETHSIDSVTDLTSKIENWKQQEDSIDKLTSESSNVKSLFENMHPDLYAAVVENANGRSWREGINSNVLDYTKVATDFTDEELVAKLAPGTLTAEDWEEHNDEDGDVAVKRLVTSTIENAKNVFNGKKTQFDSAREASVASAQVNQKSFDDSVAKAKAAMLTDYKDADSAYVDSLEATFTENSIVATFYNEDGTLKEDAFKRLAMAKDGAGLIERYEKLAQRRVETATNQEILSRGADAPNVTKGSNSNTSKEEVRQEVQDALSAIKGLGSKSVY